MVYSPNDLVRAAPPPSFPSPKEPLTFGQSSGDRNVGPLTLSSDICQLLSMWFTKLMAPGFPGFRGAVKGRSRALQNGSLPAVPREEQGLVMESQVYLVQNMETK